MKKYILTLLLFFCLVTVNGQANYYVSVVKGKVLKANGTLIKPGDKLSSLDKINFSSKTDQLILLQPGSGRLSISPQNNLSNKSISLTGFIKDFLELSSQQKRLSANSKRPVDSLKTKKKTSLKM